MNALLVVLVTCLLAVSAVKAETYPANYDYLDAEELLNNEDKVLTFGRCLLDDTVCSENALKLKEILLDAFGTMCSKCSDRQKHMLNKAVQYIHTSPPEQWKQLLKAYDPDGKRSEVFARLLREA